MFLTILEHPPQVQGVSEKLEEVEPGRLVPHFESKGEVSVRSACCLCSVMAPPPLRRQRWMQHIMTCVVEASARAPRSKATAPGQLS